MPDRYRVHAECHLAGEDSGKEGSTHTRKELYRWIGWLNVGGDESQRRTGTSSRAFVVFSIGRQTGGSDDGY